MYIIRKTKQLLYPKEFRITPLGLHAENFKNIEILIDSLSEKLKSSSDNEVSNEGGKTFYSEVAVGIWRLKKRMINSKDKKPLPEMEKAYRHLESILLTLEKEGIEIKDHDGQIFNSGLSIKVLAFQPTPEINEEIILETIKPSVYLKGERILMGEVIVGNPID